MRNITAPVLEKGSKKLINAWAFYDWANSVYSLVISSAIFPIYYGLIFSETNSIPFFGYEVKNTAMISFVTASAFLVVAFMSPLLSGIADYIGNKKRFMKLFVYTYWCRRNSKFRVHFLVLDSHTGLCYR